MSFFQKLFIATILFISTQSRAFTPESGFWVAPGVPGVGYALEIQDNWLSIAIYVYDIDGNPTFYTAGATLTGNSLFNGELHYTYNGTCIDCNITQPITLVGDGGPITINFITETTATIQFQGAVRNIERFNFILGDEAEQMLGEWQTIIDLSSLGEGFPFSADVLLFDLTSITGNEKFAEGCRPDNTLDGFCSNFALNNHEVAATFDYDANQLLVVVDEDDDFWLAYYLDLGLNQFDGVAEIYPKDGGHNNVFYPVRGFRTASRSFVETGVGPSKKAKYDSKEIIGAVNKLGTKLPKKAISSFDKKDQTKILKRQAIIKKLIGSLDSK